MTGYVYDAEGTRVAKGTLSAWTCDIKNNGFTPISDYIIGPGGEQLTEVGSDGQGNMVWSHTNVFAAGTLIGTYDKDGLHFYLSDWLGSRRVQTDYAGVTEQSCTNLPFGDNLNCGSSLTSPTEHHFTGKERDAESGNDYFMARYYSSSMGRFLNPDWSAKVMPVPYAKLDDPQSLDLYLYVQNNPLTRFDADGHKLDCSGKNSSTIGCLFLIPWNITRGMSSAALTAAKPIPGLFYTKGFKGTGDEVKVKVGPIKVEIGHKEGVEDTRHFNGEHEVKNIKSDDHAKFEAGPVSAGAERTVTGDESKPEWQPTGSWKDRRPLAVRLGLV